MLKNIKQNYYTFFAVSRSHVMPKKLVNLIEYSAIEKKNQIRSLQFNWQQKLIATVETIDEHHQVHIVKSSQKYIKSHKLVKRRVE